MHREADVVPRLLDAAGLDRAVLLGHSDGGSIALLAAARWPDRVEALALEAPHVFVEDVSVASIAAIRERYLADEQLRSRLAAHHAHVDEVFVGWSDVWLSPDFRALEHRGRGRGGGVSGAGAARPRRRVRHRRASARRSSGGRGGR